ncbi:MAG: C39 family peptidase [Anaerolineales bacterium]|nr:MAG: C39 family peptidase [Anaerolineales bacterium]
MRIRNIALGLLGLLVLALLVYQIPWVKERLEWRLDLAQVFVRSRLNPVGELPPPQIAVSSPVFQLTQTPMLTTPTATLQATPTPLPPSVLLPPPAHVTQGPNNCGPATLAMYLRYYGWDRDQYTISDVIKPVTADRNVNVDELDHYVRVNVGALNTLFRVNGSLELIKQLLAAGVPVMVEKGHVIEIDYLFNDDYWNGHYALVTGYDDATQEFIFQDSYNGPDQRMGYEEFDMWWQHFNRVYNLVFRPDQSEVVQAILGDDWDASVNRQNALVASQEEVQQQPDNAYAWFNLGMNQVNLADYANAAVSFDQARVIGWPMRMLRYQFGPFFAYYHTNRLEDLQKLVDYALVITPNSEEVLIWRGWLMQKQGDHAGMLEQFNLARAANPNSSYVELAFSSINQ